MLLKTIRVRKKSSPWITKTVRKEMDRRDRLFRFYRRNPTSGAWNIFKAQRNRVVWLQRKAKMEYLLLQTTVQFHFSQFPARCLRSMSITSSHNIFTITISSTLFSLDFALLTPLKPFSSTASTNGIKPSIIKCMLV